MTSMSKIFSSVKEDRHKRGCPVIPLVLHSKNGNSILYAQRTEQGRTLGLGKEKSMIAESTE